MEELKAFIRNFLHNDGQRVSVSVVIGKITAFLTSLLVIRLLSKTDFGDISIVLSWFTLFASFSGLGSPSILLRYGSIETEPERRKSLSAALFWDGFLPQVVISFFFLLISFFYLRANNSFFWIFLVFGIRLVGIFIMSHIQARQRVNLDNRAFSRSSNGINLGSFFLVMVGTYLFGITGYLSAMAVSPFLSLFWLMKSDFSFESIHLENYREMRAYGLLASFNSLLSEALFSLDIMLLGCFSSTSEVAGYRVAILIPSNLAFLSLMFIHTDFPRIAKYYQEKVFLINYIKNYYRIFIPVVFVLSFFGYILRDHIIILFFGEKYSAVSGLFVILLIAYSFNLLTRNLFGNLLAAVGNMKSNMIISAFTLFLLMLTATVLVPKLGVCGMAYSVLVTFFVSGLVYAVVFMNYVFRQK